MAREFSLWSLLRAVLEQGAAINQDSMAGKYPTYEHWSARMDEAARERADELEQALTAELDRLRAQLDAIWGNCRVVFYPSMGDPRGDYPFEHAPGAGKDSRSMIEQRLSELTHSAEAPQK